MCLDLSPEDNNIFVGFYRKHLLIFVMSLPLMDPSEVSREIVLEFNCRSQYWIDFKECGVKILTDVPKGIKCWGSGEENWQISEKEDNRNLKSWTLDHKRIRLESMLVNLCTWAKIFCLNRSRKRQRPFPFPDESDEKEDNRILDTRTSEDHEYESVSVNQEDFLGTKTRTSAPTAYEKDLYLNPSRKRRRFPFPDSAAAFATPHEEDLCLEWEKYFQEWKTYSDESDEEGKASNKEDSLNANSWTSEDHEYESVSVNQEDFLGTVTKTSAPTEYEEELCLDLSIKLTSCPFPDSTVAFATPHEEDLCLDLSLNPACYHFPDLAAVFATPQEEDLCLDLSLKLACCPFPDSAAFATPPPTYGFYMRIDDEDDVTITESESGEASNKEDNEEGDISEFVSDDNDEDIAQDGDNESRSRKFLQMFSLCFNCFA